MHPFVTYLLHRHHHSSSGMLPVLLPLLYSLLRFIFCALHNILLASCHIMLAHNTWQSQSKYDSMWSVPTLSVAVYPSLLLRGSDLPPLHILVASPILLLKSRGMTVCGLCNTVNKLLADHPYCWSSEEVTFLHLFSMLTVYDYVSLYHPCMALDLTAHSTSCYQTVCATPGDVLQPSMLLPVT